MDLLLFYGFGGLNWFVFTAVNYRETVTEDYKYLWRYFWLCIPLWPWIVMQMLTRHKRK